MIRVIIADDHPLVRKGLWALLSPSKDIQIVGEADDGAGAVSLALELTPDVLLIDISMPGQSGMHAIRQIRSKGLATRILVHSMNGDPGLIDEALKQGASGYVLKGWNREELLTAIRSVASGGTFLGAALVHAPESAP